MNSQHTHDRPDDTLEAVEQVQRGRVRTAYPARPLAKTLLALGMCLGVWSESHAATACEDTCERAAVQSYLNALVSHNAAAVPFAADATRYENGSLTGASAAQLRNDLDTSAKYLLIADLRDETLIGTAGNYVAIYTLDVGQLGALQLASSRIYERFKVVDGLITQIEAGIVLYPGKLAPLVWPAN